MKVTWCLGIEFDGKEEKEEKGKWQKEKEMKKIKIDKLINE